MAQKMTPGAKSIQLKLKSLKLGNPAFHIVLGSGFKDSLKDGIPSRFTVKGELPFAKVKGLKKSTVVGHTGKYVFIQESQSKKVGIIQVGRLHGYEGLTPQQVVQTVMITRELGCPDYFITNAAGGIDSKMTAGDVMMITDHVNLTGNNPLAGANPKRPDGREWGERFPDMTHTYDRELRTLVKSKLTEQKLRVHDGVYMGVYGPTFETPAEIRFYRMAGAHAVGMSTVWEVVALKHSGARLCGVSLIGNMAAGLSEEPSGELKELNHLEILEECKLSSTAILKGILNAI